MEDGFAQFNVLIILIGLILGGVLLVQNYQENRQCQILASGGTKTHIEQFFLVQDKCYVELQSGIIIDADNYRGVVD